MTNQILSLQEQLDKGPNAQLARLQQENTILRDALNQATSQAESKWVHQLIDGGVHFISLYEAVNTFLRCEQFLEAGCGVAVVNCFWWGIWLQFVFLALLPDKMRSWPSCDRNLQSWPKSLERRLKVCSLMSTSGKGWRPSSPLPRSSSPCCRLARPVGTPHLYNKLHETRSSFHMEARLLCLFCAFRPVSRFSSRSLMECKQNAIHSHLFPDLLKLWEVQRLQ